MEREDYKKKIALCNKLGANRFQKIVLKVEDIKFKVIKKLFPNFIEHYDRYIDSKRDKKLQVVTEIEARQKIINDYRNQKIAMRRELNREQNRNYHMDENKPTEFISYLNWNKAVHKKGLIKNCAVIIGALGLNIFGIAPTLTTLAIIWELLSAFINFQCINIQNSHIYRFKMLEPALKKREERKSNSNLVNYSKAANVYGRTIQNTIDVPTIEQVIANIKTPEEVEQLRKMIESVRRTNSKLKQQKQSIPKKTANIQVETIPPEVDAKLDKLLSVQLENEIKHETTSQTYKK